MRHRREEFGAYKCQPIRGGSFTFRTFHSDNRKKAGPGQFTIDKLVTITLPAIEGEVHKTIPTMQVLL